MSLSKAGQQWYEVIVEDLGPFGRESEGRLEDADHRNNIRHLPCWEALRRTSHTEIWIPSAS